MRAIILMFDSLNRHMLEPYADTFVQTPNFTRLAEHTVMFENFYAGSMPCMPARREMHTGRYNFLHRSWGPLEPFDDSVFEMLKNAGVHTHLASDHPHYREDGGGTYHPRYTTAHGWRAKGVMPWYNELVHLPFFIWDPRKRGQETHSPALAQTIDPAPTLLQYFEVEPTADMQGHDLAKAHEGDMLPRDSALFGLHGAHVNVTDGRWVYMRAAANADNTPLESSH